MPENFEKWCREVNYALRDGNSVTVGGFTYHPANQKLIRAYQGRVHGIEVGNRVITVHGPGEVISLGQSNYLPRILVKLDDRYKWYGKTKILGITS